jgi:hypothetical protein
MSEKPIGIDKPDCVLQIIKYTLQGLSDDKIGKKLGMSAPGVNQMLARFEKTYPRMLKFVEKVKKAKYFVLDFSSKKAQEQLQKLAVVGKERLLAQGIPVVAGRAALGFKVVDGKYQVDLEKVPAAKEMFETYYNGGNIRKWCKKHGLAPQSARRMMGNRLYIGTIKRGDNEYRFPELAIIDGKLWRACQNIRYRSAHVPFGFMRKNGQDLMDPEKGLKVQQMFQLRVKDRKTIKGIARETGLPRHLVAYILENPVYANKARVPSKQPYEWPDAGVEEIIPLETWLKAQEVYKGFSGGRLSAELGKRRINDNITKVVAFIASKEPEGAYWSELVQHLPFSKDMINNYLRKANDKVEKHDEKWHVRKDYLELERKTD